MFNRWFENNPYFITGIHPNQLAFYMRKNKPLLEDFESKYGNIITFRTVYAIATKIRNRVINEVIDAGAVDNEQADHIRHSMDCLEKGCIWNNIHLTSKINDDLVRHLTSLIFWEEVFDLNFNFDSSPDSDNSYLAVSSMDNTEILRKFLKKAERSVCLKEFGLADTNDPIIADYVSAIQSLYPTFADFEKTCDKKGDGKHWMLFDMALIEAKRAELSKYK